MDLINFTESDLRAFSDHRADMEDDSMSYLDTPAGDYIDQSSYDKQKSYLETYVNSVPYECESIEYMHQRLEEIVGKIYICAKSQNWLALATWDGMLQWYAPCDQYSIR